MMWSFGSLVLHWCTSLVSRVDEPRWSAMVVNHDDDDDEPS